MNRKEKISKLIAEGFTTNTLSLMSDKHISVLVERICKTDTNEVVMVPKTKPDEIEKLKKNQSSYEVYEEDEEKPGDKVAGKKEVEKKKIPTKGEKSTEKKAPVKDEKSTEKKVPVKDKKSIEKKAPVKKTESAGLRGKVKVPVVFPGLTNKNTKEVKGDNPASIVDVKKGFKTKGISAKLGKDAKETQSLNEWVDKQITNTYHPKTTKGEIMNYLQRKINEGYSWDDDSDTEVMPDIARPRTKPRTEPEPQEDPDILSDPMHSPSEDDDAYEREDPSPKFSKDEKFPEFLTLDQIRMSLNETKKNVKRKKK